ncbi:hypothetical protein D9M71_412810 [compost metagenome]
MLELLLQLAIALQHSRQFVDQVVTAALDQLRGFLELIFSSIEVRQRSGAGDRFNTAYAGSDAAFADDLQQADIASTLGVDTAT